MELSTKQDRSVFYYIQNLFSDVSYITVVDDFPAQNLVVPTISVVARTISLNKLELGNRKGYSIRLWDLDVFASTKGQRDEIGYRILSNIEDNIPVYDYDEGFPNIVDPTQIGCLQPEQIKMEVVDVNPNLVSKLYWRSRVSFTATYSAS